jgi:hypothetical protein
MENKISLTFGHTDKKGTVHKDITFGKRLTAGDMMLLDADPRAQNPTQYQDFIHQKAITVFGELKVPVALDVLLGLNSIDRTDIRIGFEKFCQLSREDREYDYPANNVVKLCFGFEIDGTQYPTVELGRLNTGKDEVEADAVSERGIIRECFLLGRRITKLSTDKSAASIDGPVDLDKFKSLDGEDLILLRTGARIAEQFFRLAGKEDAQKLDTEGGDRALEGNGDVGGGDHESADAKDPDISAGSSGAA